MINSILYAFVVSYTLFTAAVAENAFFDAHESSCSPESSSAVWTIEDIGIASLSQNMFTSPEFPADVESTFKWRLEVYSHSDVNEENIKLSVNLRLVSALEITSKRPLDVPVMCYIKIRYPNHYESVREYFPLAVHYFSLNRTVPLCHTVYKVSDRTDDDYFQTYVRVTYSRPEVQNYYYQNQRILPEFSCRSDRCLDYVTKNFTLKWTLKNFQVGALTEKNHYLLSALFPSDDESGFKWRLQAKALLVRNEMLVTLYLRLKSRSRTSITLGKSVVAHCFVRLYRHYNDNRIRSVRRRFALNNPEEVFNDTFPIEENSDSFYDWTITVLVKVQVKKN